MNNCSKSNFVSIIVPVYNDRERLRLCLDALQNQSYHEDNYEIIVVDNNSSDDIKSLVDSYTSTIYSFESRQGSYEARNKGVSISKGDILGFTDSDCIPEYDWIEKGVKRFLKVANCGLVAGRINFYYRNADCPTLAEIYDSENFLNQESYVEEQHFGATANLFTSKEVFDQAGLFNSQLKSGGDREWGRRVFSAGYRLIYADNVCIRHPARSSIKELRKKVLRVVEGQYNSENITSEGRVNTIKDYVMDAKPSLTYIFDILFLDRRMGNFKHRVGLIYIYISLRHTRALRRLQLSLNK